MEDVLFAGQDGEFELKDVIEDRDTQQPEERILEEESKERLVKAIERLTEREQMILNLYYKEELTLKEIAGILGVTLSRVSQIHGKTLAKLRGIMKDI